MSALPFPLLPHPTSTLRRPNCRVFISAPVVCRCSLANSTDYSSLAACCPILVRILRQNLGLSHQQVIANHSARYRKSSNIERNGLPVYSQNSPIFRLDEMSSHSLTSVRFPVRPLAFGGSRSRHCAPTARSDSEPTFTSSSYTSLRSRPVEVAILQFPRVYYC